MSLPTRKIGATTVSAIGYGAMGIAAAYGTPHADEERFKVDRNCHFSTLKLGGLS